MYKTRGNSGGQDKKVELRGQIGPSGFDSRCPSEVTVCDLGLVKTEKLASSFPIPCPPPTDKHAFFPVCKLF